MNTELIVHPTAAYRVPRGKRRSAKPAAIAKAPKGPTVADLRAILSARGIKSTTKHTKAELIAMNLSGTYAPPAAYAAAKVKRSAE